MKRSSKQSLSFSSIPEINILSLAFLPSDDGYPLAILLLDLQSRLQLCARDIDVENMELSHYYSSLLQPTIISEKVVPYPIESPPQLISVPPDGSAVADFTDDAFPGGVLVVGGTHILLFDVASRQKQEKQRGKLKRLEARKKSSDAAEVAKAREKEKERSCRARKPRASIEWPWSEVTAYVLDFRTLNYALLTFSSWTAIERSSRYLLGDSFGRLSMLSLDNITTLGMILIPLGEVSSFVYLEACRLADIFSARNPPH